MVIKIFVYTKCLDLWKIFAVGYLRLDFRHSGIRISDSFWNLNCLGVEPRAAAWNPNQLRFRSFTVVCMYVFTLCSNTTCRRRSFFAWKLTRSQKGQNIASSSGWKSSRWLTYLPRPLISRSQRLHGQPIFSLQLWLESAAVFSGDEKPSEGSLFIFIFT